MSIGDTSLDDPRTRSDGGDLKRDRDTWARQTLAEVQVRVNKEAAEEQARYVRVAPWIDGLQNGVHQRDLLAVAVAVATRSSCSRGGARLCDAGSTTPFGSKCFVFPCVLVVVVVVALLFSVLFSVLDFVASRTRMRL